MGAHRQACLALGTGWGHVSKGWLSPVGDIPVAENINLYISLINIVRVVL